VEVTTEQLGGATVVRCDGRLNLVAAPGLRGRLDELVAQGGTRLVVDLSRTAFIDSSGLGALVAGLKRARQAGGDLRIAAPSDQVRTVLGLTNLDRVLTPYDDVSAAADGW
jgi:anti-anti-sigma factor